jgi:iron(III) transport system permease protein
VTPKVVVLALLLGLGVLPPFLFLALSSLHQIAPDGTFGAPTLRHFEAIFSEGAIGRLLLNGAVYSLGSALLALAVGATQAWLAERTDAPARGALYLAAIVSLGVPYVLYIIGWLLFLGKTGPLNAALAMLPGAGGPHVNVYSIGGMIFVEGMIWSPLAFLLLASVFRNADPSHEEAAIMCGAGFATTLRRVTLGLARPAMLALALLVFIRASESFEVPALVGLPGSARVITTTIYQRFTLDMPPNIGSASAFGVLLLLVMAILLRVYNRVAAQSHRYRTVTGKGFRPRMVKLGRWRRPAGALVALIPLVVIVLPLASILWAALLPYYQPLSLQALSRVGMDNFIRTWHSPSFQDTIANTLVLGAAAATVVTIFTAIAGWCVARRVRGGRLIDNLATLPLVFPAIVLGLSFLEILVHSGILYGSLLSLVLVSTVAYVPYGLRYAQLGVIQIHPELEEAAHLSGASHGAAFLKVVVPLLTPAMISCWLFVFLLTVRATAVVLLLAGPQSQVVAVALFDLWNNGQIGELAALGCIWTGIMTLFSAAFFIVIRRYQLPIG